MVRKYVNNVTMSKLVSTLVSHSTQADPRCDRSSTMCPSMDVGHEVCGVLTRSWRLATPRNTLENDDFTDLRILGGRARMGERVPHATTNQLTAGRNFPAGFTFSPYETGQKNLGAINGVGRFGGAGGRSGPWHIVWEPFEHAGPVHHSDARRASSGRSRQARCRASN